MNEEGVKLELSLAKPAEMMRLATDVAGVCREIVKKTAIKIKGKQYVKVEGWQSIATAHGCVAGIREVEPTETGFRAMAELRRIDTGILIATAEGFVGHDEKNWQDRDEYAKRALSQTRAISRVCRSAFAHVVVLIDTELSTTPAEEVPYEGFNDKPSAYQKAREAMKAPEPQSVQGGEEWRNVICTWGKSDGPVRGRKLGDLTHKQIGYVYEIFCNEEHEKFIHHQDAKDARLREGLIAWRVWRLGQAEKRKAFEAQQQANDPGDAVDEIPMDYPEPPQPERPF